MLRISAHIVAQCKPEQMFTFGWTAVCHLALPPLCLSTTFVAFPRQIYGFYRIKASAFKHVSACGLGV